jgi:hypothetical protein
MRTRKNNLTLICLAALITFSLSLSAWADETHWPLRLRGSSDLQTEYNKEEKITCRRYVSRFSTFRAMSDSFDTVISAQLAPGEQLIWSGKPRGGLQLSGQDLVLIPLLLIWCGCSFYSEWNAVTRHYPLIVQLGYIPFVLIGIHLLAGRFLIDALRRSKTFYGVTQDRVLIVTNLFFKNVESVGLRTLGEASLSERNDGSGSVLLRPVRYSAPGEDRVCYNPPTLDSIQEVRRVYELILANKRRILSEGSL